MVFKDKVILIISQQDWGKMFISKHHYAVELAKRGNIVYFMNSPDRTKQLKRGGVQIVKTEHTGLFVINHRFFYPYILKYKAKKLHTFLLKFHLKNVLKETDCKLDIVWSFDISNTIPLSVFSDSLLKVFMPVDEPNDFSNLNAAKSANAIFSVTQEILDKYNAYDIPKKFINHGVSEMFLTKEIDTVVNYPINIGLSGNFLRSDIDWPVLLEIITQNKNIFFNFYGAVDKNNANLIADNYLVVDSALDRLAKMQNVKLHGVLEKKLLATELKGMDGFLICYDIDKDPSSATNYHKVLEYLATGKVVVSNNITTYFKMPDLICMPKERNNTNLAKLFSYVVNNIDTYNSIENQRKRIDYASSHTYAGNINKVEQFINEQTTK